MMGNVDERTAFALARLVETEDYQTVLSYLQLCQKAMDRDSRHQDGAQMYRKQGGSLLIDEFLTLSYDARTIANRFRESRNSASR